MMGRTPSLALAAAVGACALAPGSNGAPAAQQAGEAARATTTQRCYLARQGEAQAAIVIGDDAVPLTWRAARALAGQVERWTGAEVPILPAREALAGKAAGGRVLLVVGDARRNALTARLVGQGLKLPAAGEEGYAVQRFSPAAAGGQQAPTEYVVIAGGSPHGEYYAVEYLRRLHCDASGSDAWLDLPERLVREPAMRIRANYFLTCWNYAHYFGLDYYKECLDSMAAAGTNAVYFWVAGLYESERYPETYRLRPSVMQPPQIRALIDHAHSLGMEFYLLDGLCGWSLGLAFPGKYPEVAGKGVLQCPAPPLTTELYLGYLKEQLALFPSADGFCYEMGSEYGMCQCPLCTKVIDAHGSHAFGQYQLDFLEKSTKALWATNPKLKFVYNIGYDCNDDAAYYARIRKMDDPRLIWWIVRGNWQFPGADGKPAPIEQVLPKHALLHWDSAPDHRLVFAKLPRVAKTRLAGYVTSGNAGQQHPLLPDREPYQPESLNFRVDRLAFHLFTWEPGLSQDAFWDAVRRTYFSSDMREEQMWQDFRWLATDCWRAVTEGDPGAYYVNNRVPYARLADSMEGWCSLMEAKVRQIEEDVASLKELTPEFGQQLYEHLGRARQVRLGMEPRFREIEGRLRALADPSAKTAGTARQMREQIDQVRAVLTTPRRLEAAQRRLVEAGIARAPSAAAPKP